MEENLDDLGLPDDAVAPKRLVVIKWVSFPGPNFVTWTEPCLELCPSIELVG